MYSSALSLTSALDWGGWSTPRPGRFTPGERHPVYIYTHTYTCMGRDSAVCVATRYGLNGPGIESRWGRDFLHPSLPALGPTHPPVQWVPCVFWDKATGAWG